MKITKQQLKQIIKEELGKNYRLGEYGNPTILYINFRNLKDVGENMPGGVDPKKIEGIIRDAVGDVYSNPQDEWARYAVHKIKVDDKSGGGYRDPSKSKYQVLLDFENEEDWEDFGKRLNLIMQRVNDKVEKYAMKLRQYSLRDVTTGSLFENKKNITKQQLKRIIKEELSNVLKEDEALALDATWRTFTAHRNDLTEKWARGIGNPGDSADVLSYAYNLLRGTQDEIAIAKLQELTTWLERLDAAQAGASFNKGTLKIAAEGGLAQLYNAVWMALQSAGEVSQHVPKT